MLLCRHMFSLLLGIYLGVELQSYMVILCLIFWVKLFPTVAAPFKSPPVTYEGFNVSASLSTLAIGCLFYYGHPIEYEVKYTVVVIYILLTANGVEHLFICLPGIWVPSWGKCLFKFFAHV